MNTLKRLILLFICLTPLFLEAQTDISQVLKQIETNNKTLQAQQQKIQARKLEFKADMPLDNPNFEYDYMKGFPAEAGSLTDFWINQSFDFPTAYAKRKSLAKGLTNQADLTLRAMQQEILLEAIQVYLGLVFRNKLQEQLIQRKTATEGLLKDFEKKLNTGDGNILDVNKAKLQLIEITKAYQANISATNQLLQQLQSLNGGRQLSLTAYQYPEEETLEDFEEVFEAYKALDPLWKFYEMENQTSKLALDHMKVMALPKIQAGYRYQSILGQTFQGFRIGGTIPLWENKYKVRQQEAEVNFAALQWTDFQNDQYFDLQQQYEHYEKLYITVLEYRKVLETLDNVEYLDKALALGHISTIEYFLETNYFYTAYTNYLQTEHEYQLAKVRLFKFRL